MGQYINPGNRKFRLSLNSEIYVDKSNLIIETNKVLDTERRFVCISRPRRFGKTMALDMLASYYGYGLNSHELFESLNISSHETYEQHLNKFHVVRITMTDFLDRSKSISEILSDLQTAVSDEIIYQNPKVKYKKPENLMQVMMDSYLHNDCPFVILIDEWDCLFREYKEDRDGQKVYLDFLRVLLKDRVYVALAYMTGILPIKKYGSHSALNMFEEYSMIRPYQFLSYFGFTESEVRTLSVEHGMSFEEIEKWYNGYFTDRKQPIYNPRSAKAALINKTIDSYWNNTETYEALKVYIERNFDGLQEKVIQLLTGANIKIDPSHFSNDMTTFETADDILTLLVHLGYLTYNFEEKTVRIPNWEMKEEFVTSIKSLKWVNVTNALN